MMSDRTAGQLSLCSRYRHSLKKARGHTCGSAGHADDLRRLEAKLNTQRMRYGMRKIISTAILAGLIAATSSVAADAAKRSSEARQRQPTANQYQITRTRAVFNPHNSAYYGNGARGLRDNSRPYFCKPTRWPCFLRFYPIVVRPPNQ